MNKIKDKNKYNSTILTEDDCLQIGFKKLPHFTIQNSLIYQLDRNRHLNIGCVGTPNEMLFICESDPNDSKKINDLICLHNFDYDGSLSKIKLQMLIQALQVLTTSNRRNEIKKIYNLKGSKLFWICFWVLITGVIIGFSWGFALGIVTYAE